MKRTVLFLFLFILSQNASQSEAADLRFQEFHQLLKTHCVHCHGPDLAESQLRVDRLTANFGERENAAFWIEVRNAINLGEMPPEDEPQIPVEQIEQLSQWITAELRTIETQRVAGTQNRPLRRMNRHEYTNTISDLLSMRFPTGESPLDFLPPDGTVQGFDKVSSGLLLDPSLLAQYYQVARRIAEKAIVDGPPEYPTEKMRLEYEEIEQSHAISYLLNRRGMNRVPEGIELVEGGTRSFGMLRYPGRRDNNVAPTNGFYRFTVRAGASPGENGEYPRLKLTHSHPDETMEKVMELEVSAPWDQPQEYSVVLPRDTLGNELQIQMVNQTKLYMGQRPGEEFMRLNGELGEQGKFAEVIRLSGRKIAEGWGGDRSTPDPDRLDLTKYPRLFLDYLEVEGPLYEQWPPKSHTQLLFKGDNAAENMTYAQEILTQFLPRAWRRPVEEKELLPILNVIQTELDHQQSFHDALRVGLAATLTSPNFLYLNEAKSESHTTLNDYELASRLSYLLWSSMPDEELFRLAAQGQLKRPEVLSQQLDRMLADEKSSRFVESFGRQWLRTETFLAFTPDQYLYRSYDERLAEAIVQEPIEFLREIVTHDLSMLNFIDSDFLVLNARLAEHYEIEGVKGDQFRKVKLPQDSQRGGLMGMAGVHQAGSDGIRTKPVTRAVYVRDVLFNNPPDPPPPNAGEVEPNIKGENLSVRERLLQHQEIEACAACHRSLDPYGLALENFNVIGSWRDRQDGEKFYYDNSPEIDSSGKLPNGQTFQDFKQFKQLLGDQKNRFRRALAEKIFLYAMGRPALPTDDATLSDCVDHMATNDDTMRSLLHSLVTSKAFLSP